MKRSVKFAIEVAVGLAIAVGGAWIAERFSRKANRQAQASERQAAASERIADALERQWPKPAPEPTPETGSVKNGRIFLFGEYVDCLDDNMHATPCVPVAPQLPTLGGTTVDR